MKSPTSATTVTAVMKATPCIAWNASTVGAMEPVWNKILDLRSQASDPLFGVIHGVDVVLQDNLLSGMVKAERRQLAAVG